MTVYKHITTFLLMIFISPAVIMGQPRLIITTDIGGDPDDKQSLVRLLAYANEFEIEGLIASASGTPGELGEEVVRPDLIREQISAYSKVRSNLSIHADGYPTADELLATVKAGNPKRGLNNIGEGHDTEASKHIIDVVDKADNRPVNIAIWGGQTDFAQALWRVREDRSGFELQQFLSKIRVYDIYDQDSLFHWIHTNFPNLFYVLSKSQTGDICEAVFRGMFYHGDTSTVTKEWINANVIQEHGPLGNLYPNEGLWTCGNGIDGLKEGDTPSWFYFLWTGLNNPDYPEYGSWGGRFNHVAHNYYRDAIDNYEQETNNMATVFRWREAYQRDFMGRMDWHVANTFEDVNHPPTSPMDLYEFKNIKTNPSSRVMLSADGWSDPDGDQLTYRWWYYQEPSTYKADLVIEASNSPNAVLVLPDRSVMSTRQHLHIILEVTDQPSSDKVPMTRYQRIIVTVDPY